MSRRSQSKLITLAFICQNTFWILLVLLLITHKIHPNFGDNKIDSNRTCFAVYFLRCGSLIQAAPLFSFWVFSGLYGYYYGACKFIFCSASSLRLFLSALCVVFEGTNNWMINRLPLTGMPDGADAPQQVVKSQILLISSALCIREPHL